MSYNTYGIKIILKGDNTINITSTLKFLKKHLDLFAFVVIFIVITLASIQPLISGEKLNFNNDFFQYAARHESVRKSLIEYHTFPLRAYWFGGGYPTLGDPEDPTLNPLVLLSILFGSVMGLKLIGFLAILIGGLSTYALARYVLGYTRWGALFAGLVFGTSLFVPLRIADGNPNEVYAAFLPLCLLLIGLACQGRKSAFLILPIVFYTMLSDGKLTCFMGMFYIGILCFLDIVPFFSTFDKQNSSNKFNTRPLKIFFIALGITFFIGMVRILPALELIQSKGGLSNIDLYFYSKEYSVLAYKFDQLWQELIYWNGRQGLVTVGWIPVVLLGIALVAFWRKSLPWVILFVLFGWLLLADNAKIDLFRLLWKLPVFNAVRRPYKYFSFQIVFTFAIASGQCFVLLKQFRPRWLEHFIALVLIVFAVGFLYPKMIKIQSNTYDYEPRTKLLTSAKEFYNVQGKGIERNRSEPFRSVTYFNLLRNIGTIDWHTGIPIDENAIPKYFVDRENRYIPNPEYRGQAFFLPIENPTELSADLPTIEKHALSHGLVGLWHFDQIRDGTANDSSKKDNNGKLVNIEQELVKGRFGNALMFDGNNWIDVEPARSLRLDQSYSLSVWIKPFDLTQNMERFILDTDFWRSGSRYSLVLHEGFVRVMHNFIEAGGKHAIVQVDYQKAGLSLNRWHHIAAVFDQAQLRLYVDGELQAVKSYSRKNRFNKDVSLRIGARTDPPGKECFKGLIDDVAIWDRALTVEEIKKIQSMGATESALPQSTAKVKFRPNSINVQVHVKSPGILVINQNYHRDWHTDQGQIFNKAGLIALRLQKTGNYTIHLRYIPRSFYTGLIISILSLAVIGFICWTYATGRLFR